jgi:hypothetical protein
MTKVARHWFRSMIFLTLLAVPACEYGQKQERESGQNAYRISVTASPDVATAAHA